MDASMINDPKSFQNSTLLSNLFLSRNESIDNPEISYISFDSQLVTLNIKSLTITRKIPLNFGEISFIHTSICKLPGKRLFCYGGKKFTPSGISLMIDESSNIQVLQEGFNCYFSSSIYYQANVYVFGGVNNYGDIKLCARYSLTSKKWFSLSPLPEAGKIISLDNLGRFILYAAINTGLHIYDTYTNSHLKVLDITSKFNRLVICGDWRGYVLQPNGDIYESEFNDVFNWNIVSYFSFPNSPLVGVKLKHKGWAYFICGDTLFKFDLVNQKGVFVKLLENVTF